MHVFFFLGDEISVKSESKQDQEEEQELLASPQNDQHRISSQASQTVDRGDAHSEETSLADATAMSTITENNLNDSLQNEVDKGTEDNESDCAQPGVCHSDSTNTSHIEEDVRLNLETDMTSDAEENTDCHPLQETFIN